MHRKANIVASFQDKYEEERHIQLTGRKRLTIARDATTTERMNDVIAPIIGRNIRAKRRASGMTMQELAIRANLKAAWPKQRMKEIEENTRGTGIKMGTLYAIAYALDCDPQDLMPDIHDVAKLARVEIRQVETERVS